MSRRSGDVYTFELPCIKEDKEKRFYAKLSVILHGHVKHSSAEKSISYQLGDFVFLHSDTSRPFVAEIDSFYEMKSSNEQFVRVRWFYRGSDITSLAPTALDGINYDIRSEVFYSPYFDDNLVHCLLRPCTVLMMANDPKLNANQAQAQSQSLLRGDVFICRFAFSMRSNGTAIISDVKHPKHPSTTKGLPLSLQGQASSSSSSSASSSALSTGAKVAESSALLADSHVNANGRNSKTTTASNDVDIITTSTSSATTSSRNSNHAVKSSATSAALKQISNTKSAIIEDSTGSNDIKASSGSKISHSGIEPMSSKSEIVSEDEVVKQPESAFALLAEEMSPVAKGKSRSLSGQNMDAKRHPAKRSRQNMDSIATDNSTADSSTTDRKATDSTDADSKDSKVTDTAHLTSTQSTSSLIPEPSVVVMIGNSVQATNSTPGLISPLRKRRVSADRGLRPEAGQVLSVMNTNSAIVEVSLTEIPASVGESSATTYAGHHGGEALNSSHIVSLTATTSGSSSQPPASNLDPPKQISTIPNKRRGAISSTESEYRNSRRRREATSRPISPEQGLAQSSDMVDHSSDKHEIPSQDVGVVKRNLADESSENLHTVVDCAVPGANDVVGDNQNQNSTTNFNMAQLKGGNSIDDLSSYYPASVSEGGAISSISTFGNGLHAEITMEPTNLLSTLDNSNSLPQRRLRRQGPSRSWGSDMSEEITPSAQSGAGSQLLSTVVQRGSLHSDLSTHPTDFDVPKSDWDHEHAHGPNYPELAYLDRFRHTTSRVGYKYQAAIPPFDPKGILVKEIGEDLIDRAHETAPEFSHGMTWTPGKIASLQLDTYLFSCRCLIEFRKKQISSEDGGEIVTGSFILVDSELQTLLLDELHRCNYNVDTALLNIQDMLNDEFLIVEWDIQAQQRLHSLIARFGDDLGKVFRALPGIPSVIIKEYYYRCIHSALQMQSSVSQGYSTRSTTRLDTTNPRPRVDVTEEEPSHEHNSESATKEDGHSDSKGPQIQARDHHKRIYYEDEEQTASGGWSDLAGESQMPIPVSNATAQQPTTGGIVTRKRSRQQDVKRLARRKSSSAGTIFDFMLRARQQLDDFSFGQLLSALNMYHRQVLTPTQLIIRVRNILQQHGSVLLPTTAPDACISNNLVNGLPIDGMPPSSSVSSKDVMQQSSMDASDESRSDSELTNTAGVPTSANGVASVTNPQDHLASLSYDSADQSSELSSKIGSHSNDNDVGDGEAAANVSDHSSVVGATKQLSPQTVSFPNEDINAPEGPWVSLFTSFLGFFPNPIRQLVN